MRGPAAAAAGTLQSRDSNCVDTYYVPIPITQFKEKIINSLK